MNPAALPVLGLVLTALVALVVVWQKLIAPVLLALLVFAWACQLSDRLTGARQQRGVRTPPAPRWPIVLAGSVVGLLVIVAFVALIYWSIRLASANDLRVFLARIEGSLDTLRQALPDWAATSIPEDLAQLKTQAFALLRAQASTFGSMGGSVVHTVVQSLFAVLVGALAAIATWRPNLLVTDDLFIARLLLVLGRVVIAQLRIAAFNTTMTAVYLFVILPAFDIHMPFRGLLCLFTLATGVLPVLGNLLANTTLALISFAVSPWVALTSLIYLITIHKTEYFINARTVGSSVQVDSWEILAAMLTGEALFGVAGLVTAPLLYPFFKREIKRLWLPARNAAQMRSIGHRRAGDAPDATEASDASLSPAHGTAPVGPA